MKDLSTAELIKQAREMGHSEDRACSGDPCYCGYEMTLALADRLSQLDALGEVYNHKFNTLQSRLSEAEKVVELIAEMDSNRMFTTVTEGRLKARAYLGKYPKEPHGKD